MINYTKMAVLVSTMYSIVISLLVVIMLYYTGVTAAFSFSNHLHLGLWVLLFNFLGMSILFYVASQTKPHE